MEIAQGSLCFTTLISRIFSIQFIVTSHLPPCARCLLLYCLQEESGFVFSASSGQTAVASNKASPEPSLNFSRLQKPSSLSLSCYLSCLALHHFGGLHWTCSCTSMSMSWQCQAAGRLHSPDVLPTLLLMLRRMWLPRLALQCKAALSAATTESGHVR